MDGMEDVNESAEMNLLFKTLKNLINVVKLSSSGSSAQYSPLP
jgi:hypothetical protein